ncbi:MAG TPA: protein kinase [Myxococcaceae bacterium]|jgi:serine/threonine protein kinase
MKSPVLFGKYLLLERINVGGMAEVFIAKAFGIEGFERVLAVKKILPTMAADAEFITMFIDEARISVQLNHANIVHIHELGKHDDSFYIAMEYVSGPDLRTILDRFRAGNARMPIAQAAYIASKICEGLDYAHRKKDGRGMDLGIIHRDVSPQNVLISYEGEVKIIDFGIAKAANRSHQTQAGILKGKFAYMSPEQVQGRSIDRRSDIFAVGNILFEMLTGERLFVGGSDFSVVEKVRNAEVPSVREIDPEIPAGLEQILYRSLARETDERYQWASEMQEDLLRFQLVGDTIYSSKNLSVFMKEAFAEDLGREHSRMERYTSIERPADLEPSAVTQSPFAAPPRQPALKPSPDFRPAARRGGGPTPHQANVALAASGVEESSISVDPSLPSFQLPPTDQTSVNDKHGATDTFITQEPQKGDRRRVERGEKVEIGDGNEDLIDAPTYPRPAYASPPSPAKPAGAVNGKRAEEEPPPWPSLEGRGETVIQPAPPPPRAPARREGPGKHATPKPSPGPRAPLGVVPSSVTDVNAISNGRTTSTDEEMEDPAVSSTIADMPVPVALRSVNTTPASGRWDDTLPEPPSRPEIPSVTSVDVPQLPPEPTTNSDPETGEHTPIDARTTTEAMPIPLPAPEPVRTDQAVPLPAPGDDAPFASGLLDAAASADASDSVIGKALDAMLPDGRDPRTAVTDQAIPLPAPHQLASAAPHQPPVLHPVGPAPDQPSLTPRDAPPPERLPVTLTPQPVRTPSAEDVDAETTAALAATMLRGMANDEEESELGADEKTLSRDIPELEEIRRRAAQEEGGAPPSQEEGLDGPGARTEMRAPEGWSPPAEDTAPPAALGAQHRNHTPTEGWDEASGTSSERAYGGAGSSASTVTGASSSSAITNAGTGSGDNTEEDEPPAWPSLEGRGETMVGALPLPPPPPPKKRAGNGRAAVAGARATPAASSAKVKTGSFVVGRPDDSALYEPSTSAERPRAFPPSGRSHPDGESVMTDLPAERSDPGLPPHPPHPPHRSSPRPSGARGSLVVSSPAPLDRKKLLIVGGGGVGLLALIAVLVVTFSGSSTEPVWINITPAKASVQVDGQPVKNSEVANLAPGDHELTAIASGFRPLKRRLTVGKRTPPVVDFMTAVEGAEPAASPAPPTDAAPPSRPFPTPPPPSTGSTPAPSTTAAATSPATGTTPAAPKTFVAVFETEEPDVEISIGGKALGKTPGLRLPGMMVGKDYSYLAKKAGFKTAFGKFRSDGQPEINIPLAMEKIEKVEPASTTAVPGTGTGPGLPPPPKKLERGDLACATRPQGAQIFVDGRATGRTTPAPPSNPIRLFTGKHKITFKLNGKSVDRTVDIKAGQMEMLTNVEL